ncbi:MAG: sialate O-acetylesterase, partial [Tannerella sp.]|nr:sialate O-acetylesterase [Tannerella sp.]
MIGNYVNLFLAMSLVCTGLTAQEGVRPQVRERAVAPFKKEKFHIYLLIGQSNMAGRGVVEPQDTTAQYRILRMNRAGNWDRAKDPL